MALRGSRVENFDEWRCLVALVGFNFSVSSTSFQKSSIGWPQQPLTENVLKFNSFLRIDLFCCIAKIFLEGRIMKYFSNFSVGGCWGQPMLLFWKLVDETQMGIPRDHAGRDILSKLLILLPLRAVYFRSYHYETPCRSLINSPMLPSIL